MATKPTLRDWRENVQIIADSLNRQAIASERIASELREVNELAKLGQAQQLQVQLMLQALAQRVLSGDEDEG